jgi:copper chaperone CopZ
LVTESLEGINGVVSVDWDYAGNIVTVAYDSRRLTDADLVTAAAGNGRYRPELRHRDELEHSTPDLPESVRPSDLGFPESGWDHAVVLFEASWCGACKNLRADSVEKPEFARSLSTAEFLVIDVDSNVELPRRYRVHVVPTIFVIDRRGTVLLRIADPVPTSLAEQIKGALEKGRERWSH